MYKNLSEIISKDSWQKTVIQSRVAVLQKHFILVVNRREHFFRAHISRKLLRPTNPQSIRYVLEEQLQLQIAYIR